MAARTKKNKPLSPPRGKLLIPATKRHKSAKDYDRKREKGLNDEDVRSIANSIGLGN